MVCGPCACSEAGRSFSSRRVGLLDDGPALAASINLLNPAATIARSTRQPQRLWRPPRLRQNSRGSIGAPSAKGW
jgi:hypothetical protein